MQNEYLKLLLLTMPMIVVPIPYAWGVDNHQEYVPLHTSFHWPKSNGTIPLHTSFHWPKTNSTTLSHTQVAIVHLDGGTIDCTSLVTPDSPCSGWGTNELSSVEFRTEFGAWDWYSDCYGSPCVSAFWDVSVRDNDVKIDGKSGTYQNATMIACIPSQCTDPVSWSSIDYKYVIIDDIPTGTPVTIVSYYYYLTSDGTMMYRIDNTVNVQKGYG